MIRNITAIAALALVTLLPAQQASAQDNVLGGAILGGTAGAIIGGAATGKAGGAIAGGIIGAAAGAALGSQMEPRARGYYWYNGRCWLRRGDGNTTACRGAIAAAEPVANKPATKKGGPAAAQL